MDPTALQPFLEAGPWGISALLLAAVIWQNHKIDSIRLQQIGDTKIALEAVAKSTDNVAESEERQKAQTEATKELVAMVKVLINKGQL